MQVVAFESCTRNLPRIICTLVSRRENFDFSSLQLHIFAVLRALECLLIAQKHLLVDYSSDEEAASSSNSGRKIDRESEREREKV